MASISLDMYKNPFRKGLKFFWTPQQFGKEAFIHGGKQFARNVELAYLFHNQTDHSNYSPKLFVPKYSWEPPKSYLPQYTKSERDKLDVFFLIRYCLMDG